LQIVLVTGAGCLNVELIKDKAELSTGGLDDPLAFLVVWVLAWVVR